MLTLIDSTGKVLNTSRSWPPQQINLADREHFRHAKGNRDRNLYISGPVVSRVSDNPTIYWSRRIEAPDGEFLGVMVAGSEVSYFRHIYNSIQSFPGQTFTLVRDDGTFLVRHPIVKDRDVPKMPINSPGTGSCRKAGERIARRAFSRAPRALLLCGRCATIRWWLTSASMKPRRSRRGGDGQSSSPSGSLLMVICSVLLVKALTSQFHQAQAIGSLACGARGDVGG